MVAMDGVVLYASPDGLVGIGANGGQVVTEGSSPEASGGNEAREHAGMAPRGKYVAMTDTHAFIFDPKKWRLA